MPISSIDHLPRVLRGIAVTVETNADHDTTTRQAVAFLLEALLTSPPPHPSLKVHEDVVEVIDEGEDEEGSFFVTFSSKNTINGGGDDDHNHQGVSTPLPVIVTLPTEKKNAKDKTSSKEEKEEPQAATIKINLYASPSPSFCLENRDVKKETKIDQSADVVLDAAFSDLLFKHASLSAALSASPSNTAASSSAATALQSYTRALREATAAAQQHPFKFVEDLIEVPAVVSDATASTPVPATIYEELKAVRELQRSLATVVYQTLLSLNVLFVQQQVRHLKDLKEIENEAENTTTKQIKKRDVAVVPLAELGPALLLATRACCCPFANGALGDKKEQRSSSSKIISNTSNKLYNNNDNKRACTNVCPGGCGNEAHDLITRAYYYSSSSSPAAPYPHPQTLVGAEVVVAVEIPLTAAASDFVVSNERDYLIGVAHSGHDQNDNNVAATTRTTNHQGSSSSLPSSSSSSSLVVRLSDMDPKAKMGYALQTHIKGLNMVLRMNNKNNDNSNKKRERDEGEKEKTSEKDENIITPSGKGTENATCTLLRREVLPPHSYAVGCAAIATAALACRESSTHANQYVPAGGIRIAPSRVFFPAEINDNDNDTDGTKSTSAAAAAAGTVPFVLYPSHPPLSVTRGGHTGISTGAASASANPLAQKALCFDVLGRLVEVSLAPQSLSTRGGDTAVGLLRPLSTTDFVRPFVVPSPSPSSSSSSTQTATPTLRDTANTCFKTPIIVVSGTSAEAGKSTLAKKLLLSLKKVTLNEWRRNGLTSKNKNTGRTTTQKPNGGKGEEEEGKEADEEKKEGGDKEVEVEEGKEDRPLRIAYVKATGTSSWGDTIHAQRAGIPRAYDQLDGGLPTTYAKDEYTPYMAALALRANNTNKAAACGGAEAARKKGEEEEEEEEDSSDAPLSIPHQQQEQSDVRTAPFDQLSHLALAFLHAQSDGADVIVTELGGDIIFAKNPQLLQQYWFWSNVVKCFVICNDSMATIGVVHYLCLGKDVSFENFIGRKTTTTKSQRANNDGDEECDGDEPFSFNPSSDATFAGLLEQRVPFAIQFVASPFRTYDGAVSRAEMLGLPPVMNPNTPIDELAALFKAAA